MAKKQKPKDETPQDGPEKPAKPAVTIFDPAGNTIDAATAAIAEAVHQMVANHLANLVERGATPEQVHAAGGVLAKKAMSACDCVLAHRSHVKMLGGMPGEGGGLMGLLSKIMGAGAGGPDEDESTATAQEVIDVGGTFVSRSSKPTTGRQLAAWAYLHDRTRDMSALAAQIGAKGGVDEWSDEVVADLHRRLLDLVAKGDAPSTGDAPSPG